MTPALEAQIADLKRRGDALHAEHRALPDTTPDLSARIARRGQIMRELTELMGEAVRLMP